MKIYSKYYLFRKTVSSFQRDHYKMQIPSLNEILDNSSIFPSRNINNASLNHFHFENQRLPRQVKLLMNVTDPTSINSGNIFLNGEELFWISSPLKLIIFDPRKLSNVVEYSINHPIQIIFSFNLYLILTHANSYVTLINFPKKFSNLFYQNDVEDYNFYIHTKNKKETLKTKLYPPTCHPIPSSFQITAAQGPYIGCSDGVIRSFQVIGHWPDSNFFIKKVITGALRFVNPQKNPILSLKISGNILYSLDAANNLTAYHITTNNLIEPIDIPISLPGKFLNMAPFCDSVILTKQMGSYLMVATTLKSTKAFRIKKDGVIICSNTESNFKITTYVPRDSIYVLNNVKKDTRDEKSNERITAFWPTSSSVTGTSGSGSTVIIYLKFCYYKNDDEYKRDFEKYKQFEYRIKAGDIITFVYDKFKPPTPFINMSDQFFPFEVNENKNQKEISFIYTEKVKEKVKVDGVVRVREKRKEKSVNIRPISININEIDDFQNDSFDKNDEMNDQKNSCLCVFGNYSLCSSSKPGEDQITIESEFGIDNITHSIWSKNGSIFCIINSLQPNFGNLLTFQYGINPVAHLQIITGRILSYSTINKSECPITTFKKIDKDSSESLFIFTSEGLFSIYLNKESSYMNRVQLNSINHLLPFYMKRATVKNLSDFRKMFEDEFSAICPEKKDDEKKNKNDYFSCQRVCDRIKTVVNDDDMDKVVSNLHLDALVEDYPSIEAAIKNFYDKKIVAKENPTKIRPSRSRTNSFLSITPSNNTTGQNSDKEINTLYKTFHDLTKNNDPKNLEEFAKEIVTTDQIEPKFKVDCLTTWIADEINKSMEKSDDEKTSELVKSMSNAQEELWDFYETELFE